MQAPLRARRSNLTAKSQMHVNRKDTVQYIKKPLSTTPFSNATVKSMKLN